MLPTDIVRDLKRIAGADHVLVAPTDLLVFEYDATIERGLPDAVVLPATTQEVAAVVRLAAERRIPIVPRGSGTGLSGGSVPSQGGIALVLTRMNHILELDPVNRIAVVEAGVINFEIDRAARKHGLFFAPDPSSYKSCTIGGNVAENAGGPHCLAYGVTSNHVLGLEVVLADGSIVEVGGRLRDQPGYDLTGLIVGSEGTLCVVTKVIVRLLPVPETGYTLVAQFKAVEDAANAVSQMIASGIVPQCMEVTQFDSIARLFSAGADPEVTASMIVEVEGLREDVAELGPAVRAIIEANRASSITVAADDAEREQIWAARRSAAGMVGLIAPNAYVIDGVCPRTKLPQLLRKASDVAKKYDLLHVAAFHAGDGNLHPNFIFDASQPGVVDRVAAAAGEILRACVDAGGSITGEHGVGLEKREHLRLMFNDADLAAMQQLRSAFGAQLLNPGKLFPEEVAALTP
ncbi:MAG: FAD-linked oxidase C-terminal domain-containing protein [Dehalococcoidia bacterium]|jgi:glycolate oxidase